MKVIASEMIEQHMEGDGIEPKAETPIDTFGCLNCNATFFQRMFLYCSDTISLMFITFTGLIPRRSRRKKKVVSGLWH